LAVFEKEEYCPSCTSFRPAAPDPVYQGVDGRRYTVAGYCAYADLVLGDSFALVGESGVHVRGQAECRALWRLVTGGDIRNLAVVLLRPAEDDLVDLGPPPF
jgi:hypothetical protein